MHNPVDRSKDGLQNYGWTAVPHDQSTLLRHASPWDPSNFNITEIQVPDSEIAKKVEEYAKTNLPESVFNHSMRVYYYGQ